MKGKFGNLSVNAKENYIYTRRLSEYSELNQKLYLWVIQETKLGNTYYNTEGSYTNYSTKFVVEAKEIKRTTLPQLNLILQKFSIGHWTSSTSNETGNYTYINFNFPSSTENRKFTLKIGKITNTTILNKIKNNDYSGITELLTYAKNNNSIYSKELTTTSTAYFGEFSIIIALIFSIASAWGSYYYSDKIVLASCHARPATREEDLKLVNILDALMVTAGLPKKPDLYVVEDAQPNAFATGRNPEHAIICVTTGLLQKLDYYELEGVIAHEMSHIKNYDILLSAVVSVFVGLIVMLSDMFSRIIFWGGSKDRDSDSKANGILMLLGLICLILSPIFGTLMQLALSRRREFLADSTAVEFTRNPDGLISALQKLENDPNELKSANSATANMYIINPFKKNGEKGKRKTSSLWSTHPSTEDRIEALRNIK